MNQSETIRARTLLSIQRALLGEISKDLRSVTCSWSDSQITAICFFDGVIGDADQESMEIVATEIAAEFPDHVVDLKVMQLDQPELLNPQMLMAWVYRRKE